MRGGLAVHFKTPNRDVLGSIPHRNSPLERRFRPDMTEKLLTGTLNLNTNKFISHWLLSPIMHVNDAED